MGRVLLLCTLLVIAHVAFAATNEAQDEGIKDLLKRGAQKVAGYVGNKLTNWANQGKPAPGGSAGGDGKGAASQIAEGDQKCVTCQYVIQRIRGEMLMEGIGGGVPFGVSPALVGVPRYQSLGEIDNPANLFAPPVPDMAPEAAPPAFLETNARAAPAQSARNKAELYGKPGQVDLARDRSTFMLTVRPPQTRYQDLYGGPERAARRAQERFENNQIYSVVFHVVNDVCKKMPKPFFVWCGQLMNVYQQITEGLRGGDRPDAICLKTKFCDEASYVFRGPHAFAQN